MLGAIRTDYVNFVPSVAVLGGAILSLVGVAFLIHFIHHTATAIQASNIVAAAALETEEAIRRTLPTNRDAEPPELPVPAGPWRAIASPTTGYVQRVDAEALVEIAVQERSVVRLERGVGGFVVADSPLAWLASDYPPEQGLRPRIMRAISIGRHRTVEQDPAWGLRQISDVAARALSPGINDPTTAITCIQHLGALLARLARARLPHGQTVVDGRLRLVVPAPTFGDLLAVALDDVRQGAAGHPGVLAALLDCLLHVADAGGAAARHDVRRTLESIGELVERSVQDRHDRSRLLDHVAGVARRLASDGAGG